MANELTPFVYGDEQWARMGEIVERAGGATARDKFNAQRTILERMVGGGKWRIENWDGQTWGQDDSAIYRRVEIAARELNEALATLNFPAIFTGHELVWKGLAETDENRQRHSDFRTALEHIRARAALMAGPKRKRTSYARNRLFVDLWRVWRGELGLAVSSSALSAAVEFIATAAEGVVPKKHRTLDMVSNVIRKGPSRAGL